MLIGKAVKYITEYIKQLFKNSNSRVITTDFKYYFFLQCGNNLKFFV